MTLIEELSLKDGEKLVNHKSRLSGFMANEDIDESDISDSSGKIIGQVKVTRHANAKAPFNTTRTVERS